MKLEDPLEDEALREERLDVEGRLGVVVVDRDEDRGELVYRDSVFREPVVRDEVPDVRVEYDEDELRVLVGREDVIRLLVVRVGVVRLGATVRGGVDSVRGRDWVRVGVLTRAGFERDEVDCVEVDRDGVDRELVVRVGVLRLLALRDVVVLVGVVVRDAPLVLWLPLTFCRGSVRL